MCVSVSHAVLFFYAEISTHFYASDSVLCTSFCITTYNVILAMLLLYTVVLIFFFCSMLHIYVAST